MIKNIIQKLFSLSGYRIIKQEKPHRNSFNEVMKNISKNFNPNIIIDVGAALGEWSLKTSRIFPESKYILVEPLEKYLPSLEKTNNILNYSKIIKNVVSDKIGQVTFNVHEDLVGSSLKNEIEGKEVDGDQIVIDGTTLNEVCNEEDSSAKYLLKIDTQGSEIEVLKGATDILPQTECIILETSFFQSFVDGPTIFNVINFMKEKGFVVYDMFGFLYRPYDIALSQVDLVFVKEDGIFRKFQGYATKKQRAEQNKKMKDIINTIIDK